MMAIRLAALASGRGSNVRALGDAIDRGELAAELVLVVSNNSNAGALAAARERGISAVHISGSTHEDPGAALLQALSRVEPDVVVLAGYMKRVDTRVVAAFRERIVNIHPGPLPRFGGAGMFGVRVQEAVLAAGVPASGPTVHLVDENYDEGRILAHRPVTVRSADTPQSLAERVLIEEHDLYWRVIAAHFQSKRAPI